MISARKKLIVYKGIIAVFAFIVAFMPSTVLRSREANSRVVVELIGVDGGDKVSVTAQYVMPTETQGATSKDVVTVSANTVTEAVELLSTALGRRAELGHCSMIIVGETATPDHLATLMTATDVTADVYLAAAEGEASELVGDITEFMKKTGVTDADFIAYGVNKAHIATNTLLDFLCDIGSASRSSFLPIVEMLEEEGSGGSGGESSGGGSDSGGESSGGGEKSSKKMTGMEINKLALFGENGRVGIMQEKAARGVAWVSAPIEKGILTADVDIDGETVKNVSARLLKKHVEIKARPDKSIKITIRAVIEPHGDKFNEVDSRNTAEASAALKAGFSETVKSELVAAFDASVEQGCDVLFIGKEFYRHYPDYFETEFDLANTEVEYEVDISVK